ncbi:MAG: DNA cytosine methyltransferase, partial [Burkholderiales bacterium]|nr:DNA cytosine methyltransferase [Burkholderiales bacterium]
MPIDVIDLFAGPGGLGEGFGSLDNGKSFRIVVSAEMEESAHKTLTLRSFFRKAMYSGDKKALDVYYAYCSRNNSEQPSVA